MRRCYQQLHLDVVLIPRLGKSERLQQLISYHRLVSVERLGCRVGPKNSHWTLQLSHRDLRSLYKPPTPVKFGWWSHLWLVAAKGIPPPHHSLARPPLRHHHKTWWALLLGCAQPHEHQREHDR